MRRLVAAKKHPPQTLDALAKDLGAKVTLNQSQSGIYIETGLGSAANTVIGTKIRV